MGDDPVPDSAGLTLGQGWTGKDVEPGLKKEKGISYYRGLTAMGDGPVPDRAGLTLDHGRAGKDVKPRLKEEK